MARTYRLYIVKSERSGINPNSSKNLSDDFVDFEEDLLEEMVELFKHPAISTDLQNLGKELVDLSNKVTIDEDDQRAIIATLVELDVTDRKTVETKRKVFEHFMVKYGEVEVDRFLNTVENNKVFRKLDSEMSDFYDRQANEIYDSL